jgi:hypothetical protein
MMTFTTFASSYKVLLVLKPRLTAFESNSEMLLMLLVKILFSLSNWRTWMWSCMRLTHT